MGETLFFLFVVLPLVIVLGHGIWVALAWTWRALSDNPAGRRDPARKQCVYCHHWVPASQSRCEWCGEDLCSPRAEELADLGAMRRQLTRLRAAGAVEPTSAELLLGVVERRRRRLIESPFSDLAGPAGDDEGVVTAELVDEPAEAKPPRRAAPPPKRVVPGSVPPAVPRPTGGVPRRPASTVSPAARQTVPQPAAAIPRPVPEAAPPAPPVPPAPPRPPRKSWTEMLAAFLEERNIRWGELIGVLVGGLLIVGSSVALVISLWETLEQIPIFKFFIFVAVNSMVFGVGLYAHYRWKLESTGRGLLTIATLLVPLNFLAMASLAKDEWTLLTLAAELVSLSIFVYLVGLAAGVLVPRGRWLQVLAVVGNSAAVLVVAHLTGAGSHGWSFFLAGGLPVAVFGAAVGGYLYRLSDREDLDPARAGAVFALLGTATFAMAVALGLLVAQAAKADGIARALDRSSVLWALAAVPILAGGLTVIRGTDRSPSLGAYRTAGTLIALLGTIAMLAALVMAWPQPAAIVAVGAFNGAALAWVALRYRLPIAHAGAIACAALVYLTGFHLLAGHLAWFPGEGAGPEMLRLAVRAESGAALVGLFLILGLVAELLARCGRREHGVQYAGGCVVVAVVSLLLVTIHGLAGDSVALSLVVPVYGVYGTGCLLLNARFRRPVLSYLGLGLLVATSMWALWWEVQWVATYWAAILAVEAAAMGLAVVLLNRLSDRDPETSWNLPGRPSPRNRLIDVYRIPLLHVAEVVAVLALAVGVWTVSRDRHLIHWVSPPLIATACTALLFLLLGWGYRSAVRTYAGSAVALAGLLHALGCNYTGLVEQPWLAALLAHATLAVSGGVGLDVWTQRRGRRPVLDRIRAGVVEPLGQTAMISSCLAIPVLLVVNWHDTISLAGCLFWLASIWGVIARTHRSRGWFAACQAVLTLAVVVAATAWLQQHPWPPRPGFSMWDPRSLQVYGIGLAALTLSWLVVRILLRRNAVAQRLLNPGWPAVDWLVGHAVIVAQFLLLARYLLPAIARELLPRLGGSPAATLWAVGPNAWLLVGLLALTLAVALWHRFGRAEVVGSLLVAATVPGLVAGRFAPELAAASAFRWGLAVSLILGSVAIWQRRRLARWCRTAGATIDAGAGGPQIARTALLLTAVAPVLVLTGLAAVLQLARVWPPGPLVDTFFYRLGPELSYLAPLAVVIAVLVGFALRERSAGYAFSAGLVAQVTVAFGYLLGVITAGRRLDIADPVIAVQLATTTAAIWAIGWLAARRRVDVWREGPEPGANKTLMHLQLGLGGLGNAVLLLPALVALVFSRPSGHGWTIAAGSGLGWVALASVVAAVCYRQFQLGRRLMPGLAGLVGMAALGLLACTVRAVPQLAPEWGYRTLMLGWAAYALFIVLATWWVATVRTLPGAKGPPQALIRAAAVWVSVAGLLAVGLGVKAAFLHEPYEDLLWAAAAIALASGAGAAMAVWRREEAWAFAAAPGVNLAASLVVWYCQWYYHRDLDFRQWWILLLQANVIASAAVALVWLAARKRLYELRDLSVRPSPLLEIQTALGVVGSAILLIPPVAKMVMMPAGLPDWATQLAEPSGWVSLLLATAAAAWYLRQVSPGKLLCAVGGLGLGLGVLVTCYSAHFNTPPAGNDWLSYHVLTTSWAAAGLLVLGLGLLARNFRLAGQADPDDRGPAAAAELAFPGLHVQAWVTLIGGLALGLALVWCHEDPHGPWWSARAVLAAGLAAGLLAMWRRLPGYVYLAGLLVNVAGTVIWLVWGPSTLAGLVCTNVICLAIASAIWTLVAPLHSAGVPAPILLGRRLPFAHLAVQAGVALACSLVMAMVFWDLTAVEHPGSGSLGWIALAAIAGAAGLCLWDRTARLPLAAIYLAGLAAVGLALDARALEPETLCWTAGHELAGFVLLAAAGGWLLGRMGPVWRALGIPHSHRHEVGNWFPQLQAIVAGVAVGLGVWISIDFQFDAIARPGLDGLPGRMAGPLAAGALLVAAILTAGRSAGRWRTGWQLATFGLVGLILAELSWAWLPPAWDEPWLHRNVILMAAAAAATLVAGFGLRRVLPAGSDWITAGWRMVPVLGSLALVMLVVVLGQEALLFELPDGTPMALPAVVVVAGALAALIAACLVFAVTPRRDPLGLSDRGRTLYVYLAEALAVLIGVHLWLTEPALFRLEIIENYWMLIVMAVAFGGAALSELFHRLGLPVLSEPLERTACLLPLVPAIGFWIPAEVPPTLALAGATPALWFLGGLFYGFLAITRRSSVFAMLALVPLVIGFWVLWGQLEIRFDERPQLFLIPLGLALLVAEHLNHDRLTDAQSAGLRYLALSVIYVSSATEHIRAIGESLVLPLVLIVLSVLGVIAGVVLRIRSFLVLGITFLLVVLLTMIWYAAFQQQHMWVFWVFCFSLGAGIIALFAVFEKRRTDILAAVYRFRQWER